MIAAIRRRPRRNRRTALGLVLAVAVTGCAACSATPPARSMRSGPSSLGVTVFASADRKPLPDLGAKTLSGPRLQLRSLVGHGVVVVNVWASWCAECRSESPALAALARQLSGQGVAFVGVDEQDSASKARSFARATGMSYPHLTDPDGTVLARLTVLPGYGIPSTLFIDQHGRMAARIIGAASAAQVRAVITRLT